MRTISKIGVVGAGAMGRGIAQLFAQSGHTVVCYDVSVDTVDDALNNVTAMINRSIEKGRLAANAAASLSERLIKAESLEALSDCDLVIEAIIEKVEAKQALFAELESIVAKDAILATNTSSLIVAEIAAGCEHPQRVAGLHFFNPVPMMKVAEVVATVRTDMSVVESLRAVVEGAGHRAVVAADQPGFLVNHAGRGLYTEGLRIVEEQVATPAVVDTLMREAMDFRMGPFELLDLTGLDVSGKVMESIYEQFHQEPRFRPSALIPPRVAAGLYGRKVGEGWYLYEQGKKVEPAISNSGSPIPDGRTIWVNDDADEASELEALVVASGHSLSESANKADLILIQPWGDDATHYCAAHGLDASRCVAVDPLPGLDKHRTLMLTVMTTPQARDIALGLLANDEVAATVINDSPGFVVQRIVATIVNIAANIVQRRIASVADLEDAVRLGLGYPQGPLHLGDAVGASRVLQVLSRQQTLTGDDRYRPSLWLRRRAELDLPLTQEEAQR